jgi:hypothetical protein
MRDSLAGTAGIAVGLSAVKQATKTDNTSMSRTISGDKWLDGADPYSGTEDISAGATLAYSDDDSPYISCPVGYKKIEEHGADMDLYVMFQPSASGSIWVPLGKLQWGWSGVAESADGGSTWNKTSGSYDTSNPSGSSTTESPEWTNTATGSNPPWVAD